MVNLKNNKKGYTLIEVVVSIAILALLVSPILTMVFQTTKTNKSSENKQKALYLAQKYIEKQKSENILIDENYEKFEEDGVMSYKKSITHEDDKEIPKNFKVEKIICEEEDYSFKKNNQQASDNKKQKLDDIEYDGKINVNKDDNDNIIIQNIGKNTAEQKIISKDNVIKIINMKDEIKILSNENFSEFISIIKTNKEVNINISNLSINFEKDIQSKLTIEVENEIDNEELRLYFVQKPNISVNYTVENKVGQIKTYNNILISDKEYKNNTRLYKIEVKVYDNKDNRLLEHISSYKNVDQ